MAEPIEQVEFGRYRLLRPLGRGGMAEVYLAESQGPMSFRKLVAIKRLLPMYATSKRYVQMLLDEAHIVGGINHPNVVQVIDLGKVDNVHFIAMEYVNGVDLACVLRSVRTNQQVMPLELALHVARCIARGLHAAHTLVDSDGQPMRVVHRDVSPHNVLLSADGAVKLIDFGVAKAETNLTMTRSGVIKGKLQYMSPEQAQAKTVDCRADVFSLGMTLYKMLVGRLPFTGSNEFQIYDEILRKKVSPPSHQRRDVPERVDAIVLRALRKSADERFQTADEMARVIDRVLADEGLLVNDERVAEWLGRTLPPERRFTPEENDDFRSAEGALTPPEVAGAWDSARIERLTRVEDSEARMLTVRAVRSGQIERPAAAPDDEEPPATMQLPGLAALAALPTTMPGVANRATEPGPPPRSPTPTEPPSAESVQTSQLTALRPRGRLWLAAGLVTVASVILAILILQEGGEAQTSQAAQEPVRMNLNLAAESAAPSAPSEPPSAPPTEPPAPPPSLAATEAPPPETPASQPPAPRSAAEVPNRAWLTVSTLPWAWVYVDGQRLARHTPIVGTVVKPGRHVVKLETGDGRTHSVEINLRPGQRLTVSHAFK